MKHIKTYNQNHQPMTTELKDFMEMLNQYNLTDYERIDLALKIQQNRIIEEAFMVKPESETPGALEAIAIQLGANSIDSTESIPEVLNNILISIDLLGRVIENKQ